MIAAPLALYTAQVLPEWLDYNQHMTEGYYAVAFCYASEAFLDHLDIGSAYRQRTGGTIYTAESHLCYLRELKVDAPLRFTTQLLNYTPCAMHLFHQMIHGEQGYLAATFEVVMLHVDQRAVKVSPMPDTAQAQFATIYAAHAALPRPPQAGRSLGLR